MEFVDEVANTKALDTLIPTGWKRDKWGYLLRRGKPRWFGLWGGRKRVRVAHTLPNTNGCILVIYGSEHVEAAKALAISLEKYDGRKVKIILRSDKPKVYYPPFFTCGYPNDCPYDPSPGMQ